MLSRFQSKPRLHLKHVSLFGAIVLAACLLWICNFGRKVADFNSNPSSPSFSGALNLSVTQALAQLFRRFGNVHVLFFMFVRNRVFSKIQVEVEGNIHQYSRAWSIITQVIIEIPRRWKFSCCKAEISDGDPESCSHGQQTISVVIAPFFPPDWDVKLGQTFIHQCKFGLLLRPFCYTNKVLRKFNSCFDITHAYRHKRNFYGNLNGFFATFSTIFTSYLWRVSFRTLWRVWYFSE